MGDYNLVGRIRPVYRGVWNAKTAYTVLETVTAADNHAAYIAIRDVPAGIPLNNEEYWGVLVDINGLEGTGGGVVEETDPTVPEWAKEPTKPTYTADEVGAIADASGVLESRHYGANSINSTKLADGTVWPRHISDLAWTEIDNRINTAVGEGGGGTGVVFAELTLANNVYSCSMTYEEMLAAINANKLVRVKWQNDSDTIRNYDYVGVFGITSTPYIVFQFQSQTGYGTVFVYQNGDVKHYNGTLVRNNLTINGHALSGNIVLTADDVGALADSDATWAEIDARINAALGVIENGAY